MINLAYEINRQHIQAVDSLREEYQLWIVHLFGAVEPRQLKEIYRLTFADIEAFMEYLAKTKQMEKQRKDKEEEQRQKALLDKLKKLQ